MKLFFDFLNSFYIMVQSFYFVRVIFFMIGFFKDSFKEIKHVSWPTKVETRKYFVAVLAIIIAFGVYLFVASSLFTETLFFVKDYING